MLKVALPVLLRVTVCAELVISTGWLPKARLVGERLTRAAVPVPERLTVCGLPLALSVMLTEAVRLPLAEGVNVTLIVQLAPAASELPQCVGLSKVAGIGTRQREAGNAQGGVASIVQRYGLSRAGGADSLAGESETGG